MNIPNPILNKILTDRVVPQPDGSELTLSSSLSMEECEALYTFFKQRQPEQVIEIGMAYGVSSLAMLTALEENGHGSLISVDPYPEWESARKSALYNIEQGGLAGRHQHIHEPSELALPRLCAEGVHADFVHIDGHHGFDHAFIDWFYADRLIDVGGVVAFDDSAWRSVHKVIRYLERHRTYRELDVGLPRNYKGKNPLVTISKKIQGRFGSTRYFEKTDAWEAPFNFHKEF